MTLQNVCTCQISNKNQFHGLIVLGGSCLSFSNYFKSGDVVVMLPFICTLNWILFSCILPLHLLFL